MSLACICPALTRPSNWKEARAPLRVPASQAMNIVAINKEIKASAIFRRQRFIGRTGVPVVSEDSEAIAN